MSRGQASNGRIAELLDRTAEFLERQEERNPYRVRSYRRAADAVRSLDEPVSELIDHQGKDALRDIRGVGQKLAGAIMEIMDTARAHELGTTTDWVVIYYEDGGQEDQCTVVSARSGPLKGKRVIRGRESECREHYDL